MEIDNVCNFVNSLRSGTCASNTILRKSLKKITVSHKKRFGNSERKMIQLTEMFRPTLQQHIKTLFLITRPQLRNYAEKKSGALATAKERLDVSTDVKPIGERIKENTKTASYMGVILLGVGVTGALFYTVLKELWSSSSPNSVYSAALDRCVNDTRIQDLLGAPIKGFGEETRRRRRQHVAHTIFERNGVTHMRMQFYIQGIRNKATVHLEMKQNSSGDYEYRYLFATLDHYPRSTVILEDNRADDNVMTSNSQNSETMAF